ncbi:hypothetical protein [Rheinheimera fenheensis]|uniref:hypothetical protein n=1 Tax=Rheinheimera fenheensis TaxID=3152295 RepID=UPI003260D141
MELYSAIAAVIFSALSALFWALSAQVKFTFGYDADEELTKSMKKSSTLNGWAASFTAISAVFTSVTILLSVISK